MQGSKTLIALGCCAAAAAAAAIAVSCGDDGGPVGTKIGALGGTVVGPEGSTLQIPAGALDEEVTFTIQEIDATAEGIESVSGTYEFGPEGTQFQQPAEITVSYDSALVAGHEEEMSLWSSDSPQGPWTEAETSVDPDAGTLTAETMHLSFWVGGYRAVCTQALCTAGSHACCPLAVPGTWVSSCQCSGGADGDADSDATDAIDDETPEDADPDTEEDAPNDVDDDSTDGEGPLTCTDIGGTCAVGMLCDDGYEPAEADIYLDCGMQFCCVTAPGAYDCNQSNNGNCLPDSLGGSWCPATYNYYQLLSCEVGRHCCQFYPAK